MPAKQEIVGGAEEPPLESMWNRAKRLAIFCFGMPVGYICYRAYVGGLPKATSPSIDIFPNNNASVCICNRRAG